MNEETGEPLSDNHVKLIKSDFYKKLQIFLFKHFDHQFTLNQIETLKFLNYFDDVKDVLLTIFRYMGIPEPEDLAPEFLIEVFKDFLPQEPDHSIEN